MSSAQVAGHPGDIQIRPLTELADFERCVDLQLAVWGYNDGDVIPRRMFVVASRIGGQVLGAFAGEVMAGFAMALPGFRNGHPYLHSHMVGVLQEYRNHSIGRRLKLAQRDDALARGIELMEWTFDPLEIKNAHLNIAKLGAISRRYQHDFYGPSSSPLQGGLPTDRLYAEWWLNSERVQRVVSGDAPQCQAKEYVDVPAEIYAWKADPEERDKARDLQKSNAMALEDAFARGLAVIGYERSVEGDGRYVLGKWNEGLKY